MPAVKQTAPQLFSWLLAIVLPIFAVYPALIVPIEEHAYDAAIFHVYRGVVFSAARAEGEIYPRWVQPINAGLGGPLFNFYAPLPYYLMDALANLGITHPFAWRLLTAIFLLAASTGAFGLGLALFKRADVALLASAIFTYNSFLLRDLFERGSPQGWAVALYPWLLWLLLRLSETRSGLRVLLASGCWAMIILLHNAAALLLLPVVGIFLFFMIVRDSRKSIAAPVVALILGSLLCAFFLVPYFAELQFVQVENVFRANYAQPAANPLRLEDLLTLPSVFDMGLGNNSIGESGGLLLVVAVPLGILSAVRFWRGKRLAHFVLVFGIWLLVLFMLWMQTESATWVWTNIPALTIFQFRWKLLGTLGLAAGIFFGYALGRHCERSEDLTQPSPDRGGQGRGGVCFVTKFVPRNDTARWRTTFISSLIAIFIAIQLPSLYPELLYRYNQFPAKPTVADAQALALRVNALGLSSYNEFLPRGRTLPFTGEEAQRVAASPIANLPSNARLIRNEEYANWMSVTIDAPTEFDAAMHVLYFPGWVGDVDGVAQSLKTLEGSGYISLSVPAGVHTLTLRYEGTTAQYLGDAISIVTLVALIVLTVALRDKRNSELRIKNYEFSTPHWWLPFMILLLAAFKAYWIDPQTTWFRANSTCEAIQDANAQTDIRFGENTRLCGYALPRTEFHSGDSLRITLYWQVDRAAEQPAFTYVHLLGTAFNPQTGNPLWGQEDKVTPGEHAIIEWIPGKLYRDVYEFRIAPDAPPGDYQLEIGWQTQTGARLKPKIDAPRDALSVSHLDSLIVSGIKLW